MAEDHQRARLDEGADSQGVDRASKLIFLSLPSTSREFIRFLGQVKTARNPSALLMARIRKIFPAFVNLDAEARQHWNYPRELPKPMVWILVRGESNREGWNHQHGTAGSSDTFEANMFAYLRHLVQPLEEQDYEVVVCGDLRTAAGSEDDIVLRFSKVFGRRVLNCRVQAEMLGDRQLTSVINAWDLLRHQWRIRQNAEFIIGVYIVRADVELKQPGMADWPKDRFGFLWHTKCKRLGDGVNDVLFYVPQRKLCYFRTKLMKNPQRWSNDDLHWLAQDKDVADAMFLEFGFHHPSNSARAGNPIYRITGREEGWVNTAKFHEWHLLRRRESWKITPLNLESPAARKEAFTDRCHKVMSAWSQAHNEKDIMPFCEWKNSWYRVLPDDLLSAYLPVKNKLLQSLNVIPGFVADEWTVVRRKGEDWHPTSRKMPRRIPSPLCPVARKKQRFSSIF